MITFQQWLSWKKLLGYQSLLLRAGIVTDENEFDKLLRWDENELSTLVEAKNYYETIEKKNIHESLSKMKEDIGMDIILDMKITSLEEDLMQLETNLANASAAYKDWTMKGYPLHVKILLKYIRGVDNMKYEYEKKSKTLNILKHHREIHSEGLTQAEIDNAKAVPINSLYDFDIRNKAKCPFHQEKTASFSYWPSKNIAKCFGCHKSVDSIQFVMDYHHKTFREAVQLLNKVL